MSADDSEAELHAAVQRLLHGAASTADRGAIAQALNHDRERAVALRALREEAELALAARRALAGHAVAPTRSQRRRRQHQQHQWWRWGAAALAASLLLGLAWWQLASPTMAPATVPVEAGSFVRADGVAAGSGIPESVTIVAGPEGLRWRWRDGSVGSLAGPGRLRVLASAQAAVQLDEGELTVSAQPQDPAKPLRITTPDLAVTVLGTEFSVAVHAGRSQVSVRHGRVAVTIHDLAEVTLGPGDRWPAPATTAAPTNHEGHWSLRDEQELLLGGTARVDAEGLHTGPGAWATLPSAPWLETLGHDSWSIALQVRVAAAGAASDNYAQLAGRWGWNCGLALLRDGRPLFQHFDVERQPLGVLGTTAVKPQEWTALCGVVNRASGETRLWVNGRLVATRSFDPAIAPYDYRQEPWHLGVASPRALVDAWPAAATLAELRLWSRALSDDEAAAASMLIP